MGVFTPKPSLRGGRKPDAAIHYFWIASLALAMTLAIFSTPAHAQNAANGDITSGLVGHWKLDETGATTTAIDSTGNGYDGTMFGGLSGTNTTPGKIRSALTFDGIDDYIDTGDTSDFSSGGYSLSIWAKTSSNTIMRMFSKHSAGANQKWFLFINGNIEIGATNSSGGISSAAKYNDGQWHLFTAVLDDTNMYLYVDGIQTDTSAHDNTFDSNANPWRIGARNDGAEYFNGELDDARIYNRALSADDVALLYASYPGTMPCNAAYKAVMIFNHDKKIMQYCNGTDWVDMGQEKTFAADDGLIGHWTLDETSGATISDSGSGGNNGTWVDGVNNNVAEETSSGRVGSAITFNGTSDILTIGSPASLNNTFTGGGTLSTWVYLYGFTAGDGAFFYKNTSNTGYLFTLNTDGSIAFGRGFTGPNGDWATNPGALQTGQWYHIAVTYDDSSTANDPVIYVNGTSVTVNESVTPTGTAAADSGNTLTLGSRSVANRGINGILDDMRIYDRALTAPEIAAMYSAGGGGYDVGCASPTGTAGEVGYNLAEGQMQYCNGANWIAMGPKIANAGTSADTLSPAAPSSGLVGHWPLDDTNTTVINTVGSNGSMQNGLDGSGDSVPGKINAALQLDGTDDYIDLGSDTAIDDLFQGGGSVAFWVKPNSSHTGTGYFFEKLLGCGNGYESWTSDTNWYVNLAHFFTTSGWTHWGTNTALPLDTWTHVTITYNRDSASNNPVFYYNGVVQTQASYAAASGTAISDAACDLSIGKKTGNQILDGAFDDFRIYNRILTPTEVSDLYKSSSLIGHWKLDETSGTTATDSSGYGNDGTLSGTDFATSTAPGQSGSALTFDGSSDFITTTLTTDFDRGGFTWSAWAKTTGTSPMRILDKYSSGTNQKWLTNNNGLLVFGIQGATGSGGSTATNYNDGQWHLLTGVADDTNRYIYIDGVLDKSSAHGNSFPTNALPWRIGSRSDGAEFFNGEIDDVRIYNRALTATEVAQLYALTGGGTAPVSGCPNIGDTCDDGSLYAGISPDGNVPMYTTPADAGDYTWNDGSSNWINTTMLDCTNATPGTASSCQTGKDNTAFLSSLSGTGTPAPYAAAQYCFDLTAHGNSDWYLPAQDELYTLYTNRVAIGGFDTSTGTGYHSSSEGNLVSSRYMNFSAGSQNYSNKNSLRHTRCVRKGNAVVGGSCSAPPGVAGEMIYNDAFNIMQYCNGSEWVGIGDTP